MLPVRLASLFLSSSLLYAVALAGCSEPGASSEAARFADATPAQLERVYSASSGHQLNLVLFVGAVLSGQNSPRSCPAIVTRGQDTTVTGGCTTPDGERIDGSIALHNFSLFDEAPAYDPSQPSTIKFDDFHVKTARGERTGVDGHVELDGRVESDRWSLQGDLTLSAGGIDSTSRLSLACVRGGSCTAAPGAKVELSDLGGGSIEGTWNIDPPSGSVTVRGADVLVIDVAGSDDHQCAPYKLHDKSGSVCLRNDFERLLSSGGDQARALAPPR